MRKVSNLGCALALGHQLHPQPQARSLGNAPANAASGMAWTRGVCSGVWLQAWPASQPFQAKGLPPAGLPERQTEKKNAPGSSNSSPGRCQVPPPHTSTHTPPRRADSAGFPQFLSLMELRWEANRKEAGWLLEFVLKDISHTDEGNPDPYNDGVLGGRGSTHQRPEQCPYL